MDDRRARADERRPPGSGPAGPARTRPASSIVDDRRSNLVALEALLEPLGRPIELAQSGEEALRLLLSERFALILLDVQMPEMDGFELAGYIRGRPQTRRTPIIFVTAVSTATQHIFDGYQAGRRRLPAEARRPGDPALEGLGVHRALRERPAAPAPRRAAGRARQPRAGAAGRPQRRLGLGPERRTASTCRPSTGPGRARASGAAATRRARCSRPSTRATRSGSAGCSAVPRARRGLGRGVQDRPPAARGALAGHARRSLARRVRPRRALHRHRDRHHRPARRRGPPPAAVRRRPSHLSARGVARRGRGAGRSSTGAARRARWARG